MVKQVIINSGFQAPRPYNLETLRSWQRDPKLPDFLLGRDSDIWEDPVLQADLAAADPSRDQDILTVWIAANFVAPFHQLIGRHFVHPTDDSAGLYNYWDCGITKISSLIATAMSSVLPVAGVIVLYLVENTLARIGIIAGMTTLVFIKPRSINICHEERNLRCHRCVSQNAHWLRTRQADGYFIASQLSWSYSSGAAKSSPSGPNNTDRYS